jgi:hypothetical protein
LELSGRNLLGSGQPPAVRLGGTVLRKVVIGIAGLLAIGVAWVVSRAARKR